MLFLNFDLVPEIEYPRLMVLTNYPNASPDEVKNLVTIPIERSVNELKGVVSVSSVSRQSFSIVKIKYRWGQNLNVSHIELREKLDLAVAEFPREVQRPTILNFQLSYSPVYAFAITAIGGLTDSRVLYRFAKHDLVSDIEKVDGVSMAKVMGGDRPEININMDPEKLVGYRLRLYSIRNAVMSFGGDRPVGFFKRGDREYSVKLEGEVKNYRRYGDIVIKRNASGNVKVRDIAEVNYGKSRKQRDILLGKEEALAIFVYKQPGTNIISFSKRINSEIEKLKERYRGFTKIDPIFDNSVWVKKSIKELAIALIAGIFFTIFAVWIWLENFKISLLIVATIPLSMLGTFILMKVFGVSVNILTLGGFSLALGMIVDNSVIVVTSSLEGFNRKRNKTVQSHNGKNPKANSLFQGISYYGIKKSIPAVTSATLTTVVVFMPVLFLSGILKLFFMRLSLIIVASLVFSLLVSITFIPVMLCDIKSGTKPGKVHSKLELISGRVYKKALESVFKRPALWIIVLFTVSFLGFLSYKSIDKRLADPYPQNFFYVKFFMKNQASMKYTKSFIKRLIDRINNINGIKKVVTTIGEDPSDPVQNLSGLFGVNSGVMKFYTVKGGDAMIGYIFEVKDILKSYDEANFIFDIPDNPVQRIISESSFDTKIKVYGDGMDKIKVDIGKLSDYIWNTSISKNIVNSFYQKGGGDVFTVKRELLSSYGVNVSEIGDFLKMSVSGLRAGTWKGKGYDIPIYLKINEKRLNRPSDILKLYIINDQYKAVALNELLSMKDDRRPPVIFRENQRDFGWLGINKSLNAGIKATKRRTGLIKSLFIRHKKPDYEKIKDFCLDNRIDFGYSDQFTQFKSNSNELLIALFLSIFLEYIILAASFNSFTKPIIIIFMIPLSLCGIVLILFFIGSSLNINSFMSIVVLIGLLVNNAIMLFLEYGKRDVKSYNDVIEASLYRLKPIMITTLSTILALIPGLFTSNKIQISLSITLIMGLIYSTGITLIFLPLFYRIVYLKR